MTTLAEKLQNWSDQQPEVVQLRQADRATRRRAGVLVGKVVTTNPPEEHEGLNRKQKREAVRQVRKRVATMKVRFNRRVTRQLAKVERDRKRFMRLSEKRALFLLEREAERTRKQQEAVAAHRAALGLGDDSQAAGIPSTVPESSAPESGGEGGARPAG